MTLDDLRDQLGLTWAELARALDVPWSTLTGWRNRGLPGAVVAIARLYAAQPAEVGAWLASVNPTATGSVKPTAPSGVE